MFELADYLVGIYKVSDCTQSLTIQNSDKQRILGITEKESEKENQRDNSLNNNFSFKDDSLNQSQIVAQATQAEQAAVDEN